MFLIRRSSPVMTCPVEVLLVLPFRLHLEFTVDIGEPMLSMHSIREMIASKDHVDLISLLKIFLGKF